MVSIVEPDGAWHHLAVTWTAANNGTTKIYKDGLLMAEVSLLAGHASSVVAITAESYLATIPAIESTLQVRLVLSTNIVAGRVRVYKAIAVWWSSDAGWGSRLLRRVFKFFASIQWTHGRGIECLLAQYHSPYML